MRTKNYAVLAAATALTAAAGWALAPEKTLSCGDGGFHMNRLVSHCEMKEQTFAPSNGAIHIKPGMNGGIHVKAWDQNQVLVRARIDAAASTDAEARALVSQIRIASGAGQLQAEGPTTDENHGWSVSYEVFVPRNSDIDATAHNGGIHIADVRGNIRFETVNGGVTLQRLGGDVQGHTTNGGLTVELAGNHWDGQGVNVTTTNGGVKLAVPENYSAHIETSTVNGGVHVDFPVSVQGRIDRSLSFNLGSGGATVRAVTTNGGVKIRRT